MIGALVGLVGGTLVKLGRASAFKMAAALSYYAALSLAPLVVIALAAAGLVLDRAAAADSIVDEVQRVLGAGAADLVRHFATSTYAQRGGGVATVLGVATLCFGATGVFVELQDDLNRLWECKECERGGVVLFLRQRLVSLATVVSIGFLLLVSFVVNGLLSLLAGPIGRVTGERALVAMGTHDLVAVVVDTLFFALVFKVLPDVRVPWRAVWKGALATALLFLVGEFAIGEYLGRAAVGSAYGTAGSLVVVLVWVYYSSLIVLFGAALTHEFAVRSAQPARGERPLMRPRAGPSGLRPSPPA